MNKPIIKNNELREQSKYTPASVRVIKLSAEGIICASGGYPTEFEEVNDI